MKRIIVACVAFLLFSSFGYCEQTQTVDKNKDGKIDNWIYRDDKKAPIKWISDSNYDNKEDKWSFFKNGRAFLDEEDLDGDGKVDVIYLNLYDSNDMKDRGISLILKDKEKNIFVEHEDTGWQLTQAEERGSNKK